MNTAHKYESTYEYISNDLKNPSLLQSFVMNNNADIVKMIDYFNSKINNADPEVQSEVKDIIKRLETLMITRLSITEDVFSTEISLKEEEVNVNIEKKDPKVIDIATKKEVKSKENNNKFNEEDFRNKLKDKFQLNNKTEEEIEQRKRESAEKESKQNTSKFVQLFPDEEKRNEEINHYVQQAMKNPDKAFNILKCGMRCYGPNSTTNAFAKDLQIDCLANWITSGLLSTITWISPVTVLFERKNGVSIADFIKEADNRHKMNGSSEEEIKELFRPFIVGKMLKEGIICENDEKYDSVFKNTMGFIFDESNNTIENIEINTNISMLSRKELKKWFYNVYINKSEIDRLQIPRMITKRLMTEIKRRDEKSKIDLKSALKETLYFLKEHDNDLFNEYMIAHPEALGNYTKKSNKIESTQETTKNNSEEVTTQEEISEEKSTEEVVVEEEKKEEVEVSVEQEITTEETPAEETTVEEQQVETPTKEPVTKETPKVIPLLEKIPQEETVTEQSVEEEIEKVATESIIKAHIKKTAVYKETKDIAEHLIALYNKHVDPFNRGLSQQDVEEYMLAIAKEVLLTSNNKEFHDYKLEDVSHWLAENVIPYITGSYLILSASNDDELTEGIRELLTEFPSPKEKERYNHLKKLCESQLPKNDYLKTFVKKIKKNKFQDVQKIIKKIFAE